MARWAGQPDLFLALFDAELVKMLIEADADVNRRHKGVTVLHRAASLDRSNEAEILIAAEADVNA